MHVTARKCLSSVVKCVTIGEWSLNGRDELECGQIRIFCVHTEQAYIGKWLLKCGLLRKQVMAGKLYLRDKIAEGVF